MINIWFISKVIVGIMIVYLGIQIVSLCRRRYVAYKIRCELIEFKESMIALEKLLRQIKDKMDSE